MSRLPMRALMQLACIFLLLVAQQGALTHALWHSGNGPREPAGQQHGGHGHEEAPVELCEFHAAFGTVLGAAGAEHPQPPDAHAGFLLHAATPRSRTTTDPVPAVSRGPPALS